MANAAKRMKEKKEKMRLSKQGISDVKFTGVVTGVEVLDAELDNDFDNEDVSYDAESLEAMKKSDLVELAEELELDTTGTKAEIIERLLDL